jgi:hypothetical protein
LPPFSRDWASKLKQIAKEIGLTVDELTRDRQSPKKG